MALRYVRSGATGTGDGLTKANAHLTLEASFTAGAAGDTHYVAHDHAQTQATALTLTPKGTAASPDRILCVNWAGAEPPVAADLTTGASITTTGASALTIAAATYYYMQGVTLNIGTSGAAAFNCYGIGVFKNCAINLLGTSNSNVATGSNVTDVMVWEDTTLSLPTIGSAIVQGSARFTWRSTNNLQAYNGAVIPTNLINPNAGQGHFLLSGLDLSNIGTGKTIVVGGNRDLKGKLLNCKIDAAVVLAATPTAYAQQIEVINCNSSGNASRNEFHMYVGALTTETTIVRTGGASDGVTPYSWKIVSTANNERDFPFETFEGVLWNDTTGAAKTLTVHTVTDNVTLTDAEIWLEVEYLGSALTPITTLISDAAATILTAGANQATSTETWTTTGLATPIKQKLEVTFTPQMAGPIRWRVKYAKVSSTVYVCPKPVLS